METHVRLGFFTSSRYYNLFSHSSLPPKSYSFQQNRSVAKRSFSVHILPSALSGNEVADEEIMQMFLKERRTNGDFVSKVYDNLWRKDELGFGDPKVDIGEEEINEIEMLELEGNGGFLKLSKTLEWISSENIAPINKKLVMKKWKDDGEKRKIVNILQYEALKGEMLLLTIGIGAACGVYCLIILSPEASISYAVGVLLRKKG